MSLCAWRWLTNKIKNYYLFNSIIYFGKQPHKMDWKRHSGSNASQYIWQELDSLLLCKHCNLLRKQSPRKKLLEWASTIALIQ